MIHSLKGLLKRFRYAATLFVGALFLLVPSFLVKHNSETILSSSESGGIGGIAFADIPGGGGSNLGGSDGGDAGGGSSSCEGGSGSSCEGGSG